METNIMFHVRTHTLYMQTRHAEISISLFLYALFVELMCALQRASSSLHACLCVYLFFPKQPFILSPSYLTGVFEVVWMSSSHILVKSGLHVRYLWNTCVV